MIVFAPAQLKRIADAAEAAWPLECCGLLLGTGPGRRLTVTQVLPAANLSERAGDRFQLDPRVRLVAEKAVRGTAERVIGHYHSHPDGSALPSATDLGQAWEPDLVWLIVGVAAGQVVRMQAHRLDRERGRARAVRLAIPKEIACIGPGFTT